MRSLQKPIRNEQQRALSVGMKRLLTGSRMLMEAALEREGITLAQLRMLKALDEQQQTSAAELARLCYVTPQSMQAAVTRAERVGWIERKVSPSNRRILTAHLTRSGKQVLKRGVTLWEAIEQKVWSGANAQELRAMNKALQGALDRLQALMHANQLGNRPAPLKVPPRGKSSIS